MERAREERREEWAEGEEGKIKEKGRREMRVKGEVKIVEIE